MSEHPWVCCECGKAAVWRYTPCNGEHVGKDCEELHRKYCDDCVSRGCSCWNPPEGEARQLDEQGREYPCVEYDHIDDNWQVIYTAPGGEP